MVIGFSFTACEEELDSELVAKWYHSQEDADGPKLVEAYEFKADGNWTALKISIGKYTISGRTITTTLLGIRTGSIDYAIDGTKLILSNMKDAPGIVPGTYYKPKN